MLTSSWRWEHWVLGSGHITSSEDVFTNKHPCSVGLDKLEGERVSGTEQDLSIQVCFVQLSLKRKYCFLVSHGESCLSQRLLWDKR